MISHAQWPVRGASSGAICYVPFRDFETNFRTPAVVYPDFSFQFSIFSLFVEGNSPSSMEAARPILSLNFPQLLRGGIMEV